MNTTTRRTLTTALTEDEFHIGDNGRVFCGRLRCAGATAHASGRDLSGQRVERLGPGDIRAWISATGAAPECEACGRRGGEQ